MKVPVPAVAIEAQIQIQSHIPLSHHIELPLDIYVSSNIFYTHFARGFTSTLFLTWWVPYTHFWVVFNSQMTILTFTFFLAITSWCLSMVSSWNVTYFICYSNSLQHIDIISLFFIFDWFFPLHQQTKWYPLPLANWVVHLNLSKASWRLTLPFVYSLVCLCILGSSWANCQAALYDLPHPPT